MKRLITAETVSAAHASGELRLTVSRRGTIVTPAAWSRASELGVVIAQTADEEGTPKASAPKRAPPSCARAVDPSGVIVVRGSSVTLGRFPGAGPERDVGLTDVITGSDRSPMTAGFMSWSRVDTFPWTLDYDEIDYVLEGVLHLGIDGRVLEARPGDVLRIPKGSRVIFGTPNRVHLFYVTYPADWQGAPRP
jgi:ethanolamine utilization protein EutQ